MQGTKLCYVRIHFIKKIQHRALLDTVIKSFYRWKTNSKGNTTFSIRKQTKTNSVLYFQLKAFAFTKRKTYFKIWIFVNRYLKSHIYIINSANIKRKYYLFLNYICIVRIYSCISGDTSALYPEDICLPYSQPL